MEDILFRILFGWHESRTCHLLCILVEIIICVSIDSRDLFLQAIISVRIIVAVVVIPNVFIHLRLIQRLSKGGLLLMFLFENSFLGRRIRSPKLEAKSRGCTGHVLGKMLSLVVL